MLEDHTKLGSILQNTKVLTELSGTLRSPLVPTSMHHIIQSEGDGCQRIWDEINGKCIWRYLRDSCYLNRTCARGLGATASLASMIIELVSSCLTNEKYLVTEIPRL